MLKHLGVITLALAVSGGALLATGPAEAQKRERVGKIGGFDGFTRNCTWICHPRIKRARAQICYNRKGVRKIVYWEATGTGRCGRTEEGG